MSDIECPYCGYEQEINHDDGYGFEEDVKHEQECLSCKRNFAYTTSILFLYEAAKAPCMNGEEHKFKPTKTAPKWRSSMVCEYCGERRKPTDEEKIKYNIPQVPQEYKS